MWPMEDIFAILPTNFGKSFIFQLFPQVIRKNVFDKWKIRRRLHDHGGFLALAYGRSS